MDTSLEYYGMKRESVHEVEILNAESVMCTRLFHAITVVNECLVRLPTRTLLLRGNLSRDQLLQRPK